MLTTNPILGVVGIALTIYLVLVIFVPWDKFPWSKLRIWWNYIIPAIITFVIVWLFWGGLVALFPSSYKQPLRTGRADIEVVISSEDRNIGTNFFNSFCYSGHILLAKEQEEFLVMWVSIPPIQVEQIGNNQVRYSGTLTLDARDKSIGKPICYLAEANCVVIRFEDMPKNSKVISGTVIFTFNSSVGIEIPIPPQTMEEDAVVIREIQKYFKKGSNE